MTATKFSHLQLPFTNTVIEDFHSIQQLAREQQ
jgi:hypothetical protein